MNFENETTERHGASHLALIHTAIFGCVNALSLQKSLVELTRIDMPISTYHHQQATNHRQTTSEGTTTMHLIVFKLSLIFVATLEGKLAAAVHEAGPILTRVREDWACVHSFSVLLIGLQ